MPGGTQLPGGSTARPWHPTLSTCCFIKGQATGTEIPSRCRQDVGGNTWKTWHRLEGLCNSSGSGATPPQLHEGPIPSSSPAKDFQCGATAESYSLVLGAASLRRKELPTSTAIQK